MPSSPPIEKGTGAYAANMGTTTGQDRQGPDVQKEIKASRCVKEVWPPFYDRPVGRGPIITEKDKLEEVRSDGFVSLIEKTALFKRPAIAAKNHHHTLGSDDAIFRLGLLS